MQKMREILSIVVVLLFFLSVSTTINAFDTNKINDENENLYLSDMEKNNCNCQLLNGKYAVMTDRDIMPKTYIPDEDPQPTKSFDSLPSQFSWTNYNGNWMTAVEDQGNCGSCWAFSAIETLEAQINKASGYPDTDLDLSVQYVLSCLPYGGSCNGGWTDDAFEAIISDSPSIGNGINGVPLESCMPYEAVDYIPCDDKCPDWDTYSQPPNENDILWQMEEWGANHNFENDDPDDRDIVKSWIMDKGPMSVSMYASTSFSNYWSSHHNSDDWYYEEDHGYTNHAVVLCGWVDDPDVTNGGYWILMNSWGTDWGYGGYFNAAYGGQDIAEIVRWCKAYDWPEEEQGPGPGNYDMHVFSNFQYDVDYPHPDEEIEFIDTSDGNVALREWDFDGDGIIDSNEKNPSWTFSQQGEYEVTLKVWSTWGLSSNRTKTVQVKNNWPPEVEGLPAEFAGHELNYHFDARYCYDPDGTIQDYLWDFDDGTTSDEMYLEHSFPNPDTIYNITLTLTDNNGGTTSGTCKLKIDQTVPPVTSIHHGLGNNNQYWYSKTQRISFSATDWTDVINTYYKIDDGSWKRYNSPDKIPVSSEGEHTVSAYSVDYYGNEETPVTETFYIDKSDPSADILLSGPNEDGWYINKATVNIEASDDAAGIGEIYYRYGTHNWFEYNQEFVLDDMQGVFSLYAIIVDNAGNEISIQKEIKIKNKYAPTIPSISGDTTGSIGEELSFDIVSYDPENEIYYFIDWGDGGTSDWIGPYTSGEEIKVSHIYDSKDSFTIKVKAKNQYDVESEWGTIRTNIPKNLIYNNIILRFLESHPIISYLLEILFKI